MKQWGDSEPNDRCMACRRPIVGGERVMVQVLCGKRLTRCEQCQIEMDTPLPSHGDSLEEAYRRTQVSGSSGGFVKCDCGAHDRGTEDHNVECGFRKWQESSNKRKMRGPGWAEARRKRLEEAHRSGRARDVELRRYYEEMERKRATRQPTLYDDQEPSRSPRPAPPPAAPATPPVPMGTTADKLRAQLAKALPGFSARR